MIPAPSKAYLVCATPRSGSTLLCEMLRATGHAGQPLEHFEILRHSSLPRQPREYFSERTSHRVLDLLAPLQPGTPSTDPPEQWWARIVQEGSTENGVWGGKIMWGHVADFLARARELPGLAEADLSTVLRTLLNGPQLIFVSRPDKVAQAVSLWRALQTQAWRDEDADQHGAPVYDFEAIDYLVHQVRDHEANWRAWCSESGCGSFDIPYDRLEAAPQATIADVLEALELPADNVPAPALSRQRDEISEAWIQRYNHEREEAA
jgi:LPS sulfotransferase NodH